MTTNKKRLRKERISLEETKYYSYLFVPVKADETPFDIPNLGTCNIHIEWIDYLSDKMKEYQRIFTTMN